MLIEVNDFLYEMGQVNRFFPDLHYISDMQKIVGEIRHYSCYVNDGSDNIPMWNIHSSSEGDSDHTLVLFEVRIELKKYNQKTSLYNAKVFETGGKIKKHIQRYGIRNKDAHLNPNGTCCLGIFHDRPISLIKFIKERVYPYFVWQAFFIRYNKVPPCGECPHSERHALEIRLQEEREKLLYLKKNPFKPRSLNAPCFCGSGKQYKRCCCSSSDSEFHDTNNNIRYFEKQLQANF